MSLDEPAPAARRTRGGDEWPGAGYQTVQLRHGKHCSPDRGACVVELASMLAGEPFSDQPASVCPVIAGFLRGYNDLLPERELHELYAYAARVIGTAAPRPVRRARARRLLDWAHESTRRRRLAMYVRIQPWDLVVLPAVEAALRRDPERRRVEVAALLDELIAMGAGPPAARDIPAAAPVPSPQEARFSPSR